MPKESHYEGMTVPQALREMAEHHYQPETRHISEYEYEMLIQVAEAVEALSGRLRQPV